MFLSTFLILKCQSFGLVCVNKADANQSSSFLTDELKTAGLSIRRGGGEPADILKATALVSSTYLVHYHYA